MIGPEQKLPLVLSDRVEVLRGLGYAEDAIEALRADKVVGVYDPTAQPANADVAPP